MKLGGCSTHHKLISYQDYNLKIEPSSKKVRHYIINRLITKIMISEFEPSSIKVRHYTIKGLVTKITISHLNHQV